MRTYSAIAGRPIALSKNTESQVYGLFALAMGFTVFGVLLGVRFAPALLSSGIHLVFLIAELVLIVTSRLWMDKAPLNYILFAAFPTISGLTLTPYILYVLTGYANGASILFNALGATTFMALAASVAGRALPANIGGLGKVLFVGLLGLLVLGLFQLFIPALRTTGMELALSGAGIVLFSGFIVYDTQRIATLGKMGVNPFMLALGLYLDIFNLLLSVLRFMMAIYGDRR